MGTCYAYGKHVRTISIILLCAILYSVAPSTAKASSGLHLRPCAVGKAEIRSLCGTFGVYENRAARSGRVIGVNLILIKASHQTRGVIAFLAGGPGQSAVAFAQPVADRQFAKALSALRSDYDLLFVDNRGMGRSNPFSCDFTPPSDQRGFFLQLWPDTLVAQCRSASTLSHDLAYYNTTNAVDDLDDIRAALHFEKLVLYGASDGTFFAFIYMRRHPSRVESAVLTGVAPPGFQPLPGAPEGAQKALDDLMADCSKDITCRSHFPNFGAHFSSVLRRFNAGPVAMKVKAANNRYQVVHLSKEVLVDELRQVLDDPSNAAYIPYIIERTYDRDYGPLAELINAVSVSLARVLNWGAFLSYSCADWMPFVSPSRIERAGRYSFADSLRYLAQKRACSIWNVPPMPPRFNAPVRSNAPVLMISGSDDPATPPSYAAAELPFLPNGRLIIVKGAGHAAELPCTDRLIVQFVGLRSAKHLRNASCQNSFKRPSFATSD